MIFYWSYKINHTCFLGHFPFCFSAGATSNSSYFGNNDCPDAFKLLSFVRKRTAAQRRREAGAEELREMNLYIYVHDIGLFSMFFFPFIFLEKTEQNSVTEHALHNFSSCRKLL